MALIVSIVGQTGEIVKEGIFGFTTGGFCGKMKDTKFRWKGGRPMSLTLTPGSILAMTDLAADRLLKLDSGDAALLYIHLLRRGTAQGLNWTQSRLQTALEQLKSQGLAPAETPLPDPAPQEIPVPAYATEDINAALADRTSAFPALCDEVERRLGKKLSASDLKSLYTIYDHYALPAEVILMLVGWCTEEMERKYGPGRKPFLSQIRKEGTIWAKRGIDTMERAEEHIARLTRMRSREGEVLRLLDIPLRPLVEREKTYIAAWDDMGFDNESIRMAYEKTVLKKQSMDWGYMNGILRRWHEKGLHTAAAIQAGDRDPRPIQAGNPNARAIPAAEGQRAREDMDRMRRLMEQMKKEG